MCTVDMVTWAVVNTGELSTTQSSTGMVFCGNIAMPSAGIELTMAANNFGENFESVRYR